MQDPPRQSLAEVALLKIGKNVLNLQKLEGMLKTLVALSGKTMGTVVGEYIDNVYMGISESDVESPDEFCVSGTFRLEADEQTIEDVKESFSQLVEERNRLVHHRLLDFDIRSEESCQQLIAELNEQHQKIVPLYKQVQDQLKTLIEMQKIMRTALVEKISEDTANDT